MNKVKLCYQVGKGVLEAEKAIDIIIDRAESRVISAVDIAFKSGAVNKFLTNGIVKVAYAILEDMEVLFDENDFTNASKSPYWILTPSERDSRKRTKHNRS